MANQYGATYSKHVIQTNKNVGTGAWVPLEVGSAPLNNRRHLRIQNRGESGATIAIEYANANITTNPTTRQQQKTFTDPTIAPGNSTLYPGETTWWEPVGDNVRVYGRLVNKAGSAVNSVRVIITEFA